VQIRFGPFNLDLDTRQLTRDRSTASAPAERRRDKEIHLSPKAFDLLAALIQERPNVLSKAALQERVWPDTFVVEANVSNLVAEVREALEDEARAPRFIRTVHGFGYAFCADAASLQAGRDTPSARPSCWLQWGDVRFPLIPGEHVVGRDPDVGIRLDRSTVSRRHARFVVTADGTVLEDFGSKNGTYRGGERVTTPVALTDGDEIRIGLVLVIFHVRAPNESTETQVANAP